MLKSAWFPDKPAIGVQLHDASTVPQAITGMQALKKKEQEGALSFQKQRGIPALNEMADEYTTHLSSMSRKHEQTRHREKLFGGCSQSVLWAETSQSDYYGGWYAAEWSAPWPANSVI